MAKSHLIIRDEDIQNLPGGNIFNVKLIEESVWQDGGPGSKDEQYIQFKKNFRSDVETIKIDLLDENQNFIKTIKQIDRTEKISDLKVVDVCIIMDYSGSMGAAKTTLQTGITNFLEQLRFVTFTLVRISIWFDWGANTPQYSRSYYSPGHIKRFGPYDSSDYATIEAIEAFNNQEVDDAQAVFNSYTLSGGNIDIVGASYMAAIDDGTKFIDEAYDFYNWEKVANDNHYNSIKTTTNPVLYHYDTSTKYKGWAPESLQSNSRYMLIFTDTYWELGYAVEEIEYQDQPQWIAIKDDVGWNCEKGTQSKLGQILIDNNIKLYFGRTESTDGNFYGSRYGDDYGWWNSLFKVIRDDPKGTLVTNELTVNYDDLGQYLSGENTSLVINKLLGEIVVDSTFVVEENIKVDDDKKYTIRIIAENSLTGESEEYIMNSGSIINVNDRTPPIIKPITKWEVIDSLS